MSSPISKKVTILNGSGLVLGFCLILISFLIGDLRDRVEVLEKYEKTYTKYSELHDMIENCEEMKSKRVKNNCQIVFHIK